jgi:hypothetical protein
MQSKTLLKEFYELLETVLMNPASELMLWLAVGVVVLFAAFALKFALNVMNAGFPSFFGAVFAVVLGGLAMLFGAAAGSIFLKDLGLGSTGEIVVKVSFGLLGLLLVGAPLAAFLCRSKYMSALGSWLVALVVSFVGLIAFNAATAGFKSAENVVDRAVERKDRLEEAVGQ